MNRVEDIELYAWVGEDEFGSGEIGLKQGLVPAGMIPMVAVDEKKMNQRNITTQLQMQATQYRKRIQLVRFTFKEVLVTLEPM